MSSAPVSGALALNQQSEAYRLLQRLEEPKTAASLNLLLDNIELLAVIVAGLDGLARKGEIIGDTVAEVLGEVRAAGQATGIDPLEMSRQLATVVPTLADASPAINRVLATPIVDPGPIAILSETAVALVKGLEEAQKNETKLGLRGVYKATKDEDVRRGLGFFVEVLRVFGRDLAENAVDTPAPTAEPDGH